MQDLNLPRYAFKVKNEGLKPQIFDAVRRKFVVLTPEEWVRQNYVEFLVQECGFPRSLLAVEKALRYNQMNKRTDVVAYSREGNPMLIIECKAPSITIGQNAFDQIARYNMTLKVPYLTVTNGLNHYHCYIDHENKSYRFLPEAPNYADLT